MGNACLSHPGFCVGFTDVCYIHINELDSDINNEVSKFADDKKVGRVIKIDQDANELQDDLNKLYDWARERQMEFNIGKCSILSVGLNNPLHNYSNATPIGRSRCKRLRSLSKL